MRDYYYMVTSDDKEDGYFTLLKFDSARNWLEEIKDSVSKKDYPTRELANEHFKKVHKIEIELR